MKINSLFVKDKRLHPAWRVIAFAVLVLLVSIVLWSLYAIASGRWNRSASLLSDEISGEFATAVAVVVVSLCLRRYVDRRSTASLGFAPRGPRLRFFFVGLLFGAGMQAVAWCVEEISGTVRTAGFGSLTADVRIVADALPIFLAAALLEELSFRGYVLQNFWEAFGVVPAVVLSSVLFAFFHLYNPNASKQLALTLAGLLLFALWASMSLLWTRSLWLALGAHFAWNLFEGPVFGFPVSGLSMPIPPVVSENVTGPAWLTGGAFGPEAGASSLIALAAGLFVLRVLYLKGVFRDAADTREAYARSNEAFVLSSAAPHRR